MNDDDLVGVLEGAGLSPYQAAAYVTLLELGTTSATDLADASGVPGPRIYDVLRDLEAEGYVETFRGDALTARANDPECVLQELRTRSTRYLDAAEEIERRWSEPAAAPHEVSIVERFETLQSHARELIAGADTRVRLGASVAQLDGLRTDLAGAHDRGVDVAVTLYTDREDGPLPAPADLATVCSEARHRPMPSPFVVVVDRNGACFAPQRCRDQYAITVEDRTFARVFYWYFLTCLWEPWDPIHVDRPSEPPVTYADVGQCVREVGPLLADGARVSVRVEGTDAATGDPVTLRGDVVEVTPAHAAEGRDRIPLTDIAGEVSIAVDLGDRTVDVGGWGAVLEEYEAETVTVTGIDGLGERRV